MREDNLALVKAEKSGDSDLSKSDFEEHMLPLFTKLS